MRGGKRDKTRRVRATKTKEEKKFFHIGNNVLCQIKAIIIAKIRSINETKILNNIMPSFEIISFI